MIVELSGSVNTHKVVNVTDINGLVPIADFLRDHPDDLMSVTVDGEFYAVGTGLDLASPFNRAVEWFNPEGNQVTFGTEGNDTLVGNSGNNTLVGGGGDDNFHATLGKDIIYGGDGTDTVIISAEADALSVSGNTIFHDETGSETTIVGVEQVEVGGELFIL